MPSFCTDVDINEWTLASFNQPDFSTEESIDDSLPHDAIAADQPQVNYFIIPALSNHSTDKLADNLGFSHAIKENEQLSLRFLHLQFRLERECSLKISPINQQPGFLHQPPPIIINDLPTGAKRPQLQLGWKLSPRWLPPGWHHSSQQLPFPVNNWQNPSSAIMCQKLVYCCYLQDSLAPIHITSQHPCIYQVWWLSKTSSSPVCSYVGKIQKGLQ